MKENLRMIYIKDKVKCKIKAPFSKEFLKMDSGNTANWPNHQILNMMEALLTIYFKDKVGSKKMALFFKEASKKDLKNSENKKVL